MAPPYPRRIVCLTEETTETLYRIGAGDLVVGISGYTVRPKEARAKPRISTFLEADFGEILGLKPDLVLGFSDLQADLARELAKRGVPVMVFNQRSIAEILQAVRVIGAHIAQVEVDRETGEIALQRYIAVDDVGKVINPMIVHGQLVGGIVQGVGQALWEYGLYDEDGQLITANMMEYAMPRANQFPTFEHARIETPSPHNPLGVKGAGEMGTIAATVAVANAVMDALAPLGVRHLDMPLTPQKVWRALQAAQA